MQDQICTVAKNNPQHVGILDLQSAKLYIQNHWRKNARNIPTDKDFLPVQGKTIIRNNLSTDRPQMYNPMQLTSNRKCSGFEKLCYST